MEANLPNHPTVTSAISVVWVYLAKGEVNNELAKSIELVQKHLEDVEDLFVCGDPQPLVNQIPSPRKARGPYSKWFDSSHKLQAIIDDNRVTDNFLWMYDDTFVLSSLSAFDIVTPRYFETVEKVQPLSTWHGVRNHTYEVLPKPCYNYSTHFPVVFNKHELQKTIDEFSTHENPRLIELLYCNRFKGEPLPKWFRYINSPQKKHFPLNGVKLLNVGIYNSPTMEYINNR